MTACMVAGLLWAASTANALTVESVTPALVSTNVVFPPSLSVYVSDTTATNLTVTFHGRRLLDPVRPNFTIVAVPDAQCYSGEVFGGTKEMFIAQTEWVITNRVERNIVFVTQLGDCVQNGEFEWQWWNATNALYRLEDPERTGLLEGIPYGISPGGHDVSWPYLDTYTLYNKYFGITRFSGKSYYSGHYGENNDNHYEFLSVSGMELMLLHLQWDAGRFTNVMNWANSVLQQNRDRRTIVVTHALLNGNTAEFNAQGQPIYDALKANTNIFLMLCGHHPSAQSRSDTFNGNTIRTFLSDYTSLTNGGSGYLRIMEFSPTNGTIQVETHSPFLRTNFVGIRHNFTASGFDFSPSVPEFSSVQVLSNLPAGIVTCSAWTGLLAGHAYEWYAVVSDGETNLQSTSSTFTTRVDYTNDTPRSLER